MAERQLSDGNDSGTSLGQSASDLVGFHGATPSAQATVASIATAATIATAVASIQEILAALVEKGLVSH